LKKKKKKGFEAKHRSLKSTATPRKASKRNKVLWKFFTMEENSREKWPRAICNVCNIFIKRTDASPTGMKLHLQRCHRKHYKKYLCLVEESNVELVNFSSLCLSKKYHVLAGATWLC
jgi:hypothetical protein